MMPPPITTTRALRVMAGPSPEEQRLSDAIMIVVPYHRQS